MSEAMTAQCSPPPSDPAKRERNRADGTLDEVGIDLDATVMKETSEPVPT